MKEKQKNNQKVTLKGNIKEKIVKATIELFATRHYDGMTIPMIAKKADIAVGTMYNYFQNKETLINDIYKDIFKELREYIQEGEDKSLDFKSQFKEYYKRLFTYSSKYGNIILFLKYNSNAYYISKESEQVKQNMIDFLIKIVEEGMEKDIFKQLSVLIYMPVIYAPIEMMVTNAAKKNAKKEYGSFEDLFDCIWNALKK